MNDFKEFYRENRSYTISFILLTIICFVGVWLVYDYERNKPIHDDTDNSMADVENRISSIEHRLDTMQSRIAETQKTINGITERINASTKYASEIADGIGEAEKRLDSAIQRSGRIENLINDIEAENRKGTKSPQKTSMAK